MMRLEEAARAVGLTERQLRRRLEATAPVLAPYVRRGEKNSLLLDQSAVEILRAIEGRRASGASLQDAVAWVAESMGGKQESEQGRGERETASNTGPQGGDPAEPWRLVIAAKDETIRRLESEVAFLRGRVEYLEPLALPAPEEEEDARPWLLRRLWPRR